MNNTRIEELCKSSTKLVTTAELSGVTTTPAAILRIVTAHHVKVLSEAGLVHVVRTRRVRAIEERFYGRTARMFYVAVERGADAEDLPVDFNDFEMAAQESAPAFREGHLQSFIRHARLPEARVTAFWERMAALVREFDELPRSGTTVYGFAVGVYLTGHPSLPHEPEDSGDT